MVVFWSDLAEYLLYLRQSVNIFTILRIMAILKSLKKYSPLAFLCLFLLASIDTVDAQSRTRITKDKTVPNYKVIERIVKNKNLRLKSYYGDQWKSGNYKAAWQRVETYFPNKFYYNSSKENFMSHWFSPKGMAMDIYQSKELSQAVSNMFSYNIRNVFNHYQKIKKNDNAKNKKDLREFKDKLGLLEPYFENSKTFSQLIKFLKKGKLYEQLFDALEAEGDHMFAAALLHEGMHASVDNARRTKKMQDHFASCKAPVQWDELRGYMSEVGYHSNYYKFCKKNMDAHMAGIFKLLAELEKFRNKKKPLSKSDKKKIERIKARIKARIAIIRVRLREIQQSLDRMKGLMKHFKSKYIKPGAPKEFKDLIDDLEKKIDDFAKEAKKAIDDMEKALKDLEKMLKAWNEWAACKTKKPPTEEDHKKNKEKFDDVSWPSPPPTDEEKDIAEKKLGRTYNLGPYSDPTQGPGPFGDDEEDEDEEKEEIQKDASDKNDFTIGFGMEISNPKMDALNGYYDYLNETWTGSIDEITSNSGFWIQASYPVNTHFSIGIEYVHHTFNSDGFLQSQASDYSSENTFNNYSLVGVYSPSLGTNLDANLSVGIGLSQADYTETEGTFVLSGDSSTLGFQTSGGLSYNLSKSIGINGSIGYRVAKFDDYSNDINFFDATNSKVKVDFSGMYTRFGIKVKF